MFRIFCPEKLDHYPPTTDVKALFSYDEWNRVSETEDPFGNIAKKGYNSVTWLPDYSKAYNGTQLTGLGEFEFDDLGRITKVRKALFDPANNNGNYSATAISSINSLEMALEKQYTYDPDTGSILTVTDSFGRSTRNYYDYLNRITMVDNYDTNNSLVTRNRTHFDPAGRVYKTQSWSEDKTTVTTYDYDTMGRVVQICSLKADVDETVDCISSGSNCTLLDEKCSVKFYNTGGQVIWSSDIEEGETALFNTYFSGLVGNETGYNYNAFGEVKVVGRIMTDDGDGGGLLETSNSYNSDGVIRTSYEYDINGRIVEISDDKGAKTTYTYSTDNLLLEEEYCGSDDLSCTYPRTVTYDYDSKFDLRSETYARNGTPYLTVHYERDEYGRIKKKYTGNTANDVYQVFDYNNRNLLLSAKSVDPTSTNTVLSQVNRTYDSFGLVKSESIDGKTISSSIAFDDDIPTSRILEETITLPGGKTIKETSVNSLTDNLVYDGNQLLKYNYGTGNVLNSIYKNFAGTNHKIELNYSYTNWRKTETRTEKFITPDPDEIIADYEYTYSNGLHLIGKQENKELRREAYQYDSYYRLRRVDYDCDYNSNDPTCIESRPDMFKCTSAEADCDDFQLDGVHNIRASYENQTDYAWTVDGFNRLTKKEWDVSEINYSYDTNNNLIEEDIRWDDENRDVSTFIYDKLNRLISASISYDYEVTYTYDPFNRRTEKVVYYTNTGINYRDTHKYLYDGWNIVSEEIKTDRLTAPTANISWKLNRYIDHGTDNHVMMETVDCDDDNGNCDPDETTISKIWFHKDERGNVIAISDGNGTIYERYRYTVYGEHEVINSCHTACKTTYQSCFDGCNENTACEEACLATKNTCDTTCKATDYAGNVHNFLWGGSLYEPETGLYWMRNRYYHVDMHRFINQDPIGIWGDSNNLGNGFAYVAGMVIEASDPTGLQLIFDEQAQRQRLKDAGFSDKEIDNQINQIQEQLDTNPGGSAGKPKLTQLVKLFNVLINSLKSKDKKESQTYRGKEIESVSKLTTNPNGSKDGKLTYTDGSYTLYHENADGSYSETDYDKNGNPTARRFYDKDGNLLYEEEWDPNANGGKGGWVRKSKMPSGPDDPEDASQEFMRNQMLKKMMKLKYDYNNDDKEPIIHWKNEDGSIQFIHNPYYRQKDPTKRIIMGKTPNGPVINRNPIGPTEEELDEEKARIEFLQRMNRLILDDGKIDPVYNMER
ncbi:MAG TPA: RHS repeat-associated core domain-containing protein [bacterium]|nr:RHS repeat-associated core domain-containing protein [bacterium]